MNFVDFILTLFVLNLQKMLTKYYEKLFYFLRFVIFATLLLDFETCLNTKNPDLNIMFHSINKHNRVSGPVLNIFIECAKNLLSHDNQLQIKTFEFNNSVFTKSLASKLCPAFRFTIILFF